MMTRHQQPKATRGIRQFAYWKDFQRGHARLNVQKLWLVSEMGRISAELPDKLEKELRFKTIERFGGKKGDLSRAVEEAVKTWVAKEEQMLEQKVPTLPMGKMAFAHV